MADVLCPIIVGRDEELATLNAAFDAAQRSEAGLVCITGEAGIGKSRLVRELIGIAKFRGAMVATGRAVPSGSATPYRPLTEALLQCLRDREIPSDPELIPWLPALGAIVPTLTAQTNASPQDISVAIRAEAVIQLLRRLAGANGLVVVLEDLHWADPDTLAVVEYLADNLAGARVLCVITSRDEESSQASEVIARLVRGNRASRLSIARLDAEFVAEMVRACIPSADDEVVDRLQRVTDGIPLLIEEVLASPGVPASFRETVRARFADFPDEERHVLLAAAIFGRYFDWRILPDASGQPPDVVIRALESAVDRQLLRIDGEEFFFRHALTREAIVERLLPPRRKELAANALRAIDNVHSTLEGTWRDVAADLALQSGDDERAATLLMASGQSAIGRGALATAINALRRSYGLGLLDAGPILVEALTLAGRIDEAVAVGADVINLIRVPSEIVDVHLRLANGAIAAARWPLASHYLDASRQLLTAHPDKAQEAWTAVLGAEVALASGDDERARQIASEVVSFAFADVEIRCQALEVIGRVERLTNRSAARVRFQQALSLAQNSDLPLWQVRAMHELGTIDMFEFAGVDRLLEARRSAEEFGALSTAAVIDLQLAAVRHCRFELAMAADHARSAVALGEQLALGQVRAKALAMLAENAAWRGDRGEMEGFIGQTIAAAPDDLMLAGFAWGARGMQELLHGDRTIAVENLGEAVDALAQLPHAEPACFRAMWPVLLASMDDKRARGAIQEAEQLGVASFNLNAGLLAYAEAILAGQGGDWASARRLASASEPNFVNCTAWADIARWLAAESAVLGAWDQPGWWLPGVSDRLSGHELFHLAHRCRDLAGGPQRWIGLGISAREADVLDLVVEGLANKEIAARLFVSPRTVEKHVESLLRKLGARSRTQLVGLVAVRSAATPT